MRCSLIFFAVLRCSGPPHVPLLTNLEDNDAEIMVGLFKDLVSKLANTRINEFMNARIERDLKGQNNVVDADEMLRPRLKANALATKRK